MTCRARALHTFINMCIYIYMCVHLYIYIYIFFDSARAIYYIGLFLQRSPVLSLQKSPEVVLQTYTVPILHKSPDGSARALYYVNLFLQKSSVLFLQGSPVTMHFL